MRNCKDCVCIQCEKEFGINKEKCMCHKCETEFSGDGIGYCKKYREMWEDTQLKMF